MKASLFVGRVRNIKIYIHWTFLILAGWIFLTHAQVGKTWFAGLIGLAFVLSLFACVVLHELGHALTAGRFGINTKDITLYPIGGIARLEKMPEKPKQELLVALAGPAVNVVIALLIWMYLNASGQVPNLEKIDQAETVGPFPFAVNLLLANVTLAVFNLLPAFPMDGGRVLRALLSFRMNRASATRVAARIGQLMAILFVFFGFFNNFLLVFIGLFVYLGAEAEAKAEEVHAGLRDIKVSDVLMSRYSVLDAEAPLSKAVSLLLNSQEQSFVVKEMDQVKGVLSLNEIINGLTQFGTNVPVYKVMSTDFPHLETTDKLDDVLNAVSFQRHTVLPVFKQEELAGVIDLENITEYLMVQKAIHKALA